MVSGYAIQHPLAPNSSPFTPPPRRPLSAWWAQVSPVEIVGLPRPPAIPAPSRGFLLASRTRRMTLLLPQAPLGLPHLPLVPTLLPPPPRAGAFPQRVLGVETGESSGDSLEARRRSPAGRAGPLGAEPAAGPRARSAPGAVASARAAARALPALKQQERGGRGGEGRPRNARRGPAPLPLSAEEEADSYGETAPKLPPETVPTRATLATQIPKLRAFLEKQVGTAAATIPSRRGRAAAAGGRGGRRGSAQRRPLAGPGASRLRQRPGTSQPPRSLLRGWGPFLEF